MPKKKSTPHPDPDFPIRYRKMKQAEQARRVERATEVAETIAVEDAKRQPRGLLSPPVTASEIKAAARAVFAEAMKKQPRWTKAQWEALSARKSPEVAAYLRELFESVKKPPKRWR
jgi:hypothetical protein